MEEQWIGRLRKRFADRKTAAPENLWQGIEQRLQQMETERHVVPQQKKHISLIPLWVGAAAASLLIIYIGVWQGQVENAQHQALLTKASKDNPATVVPSSVTSNDASAETSFGRAAKIILQQVVAEALSSQDDTVKQMAQNTSVEILDVNQEKACEEAPRHQRKTYPSCKTADEDLLLAMTPSRSDRQPVSVALYGTRLGGASQTTGNIPTVGQMSSMLYSNALGRPESDKQETPQVKVKHRQPIRVGLSARWQLNERVGVETGVTYTYLSSDIGSGDEKGGYKAEQKLQYVGIPLALSYSLWRYNHLDVYAKAGGMLDICVSGKTSTDYIMGNSVMSHAETDSKEQKPQWSVQAAAGIQYHFSDRVGAYIEPGLGYYFDNGSGLETIFKEKPLNFNFNVGVRFVLK